MQLIESLTTTVLALTKFFNGRGGTKALTSFSSLIDLFQACLDLGGAGLVLDERKFSPRVNKIWIILHKIRVKVFHFLKIMW